MIEDLLATAETLANLDGRRPRQTSPRRAISNAYYATFHALARTCADELIGATRRNTPAWLRVYRALGHVEAKNALKTQAVTGLAAAVKDFADAFIALQEQRHVADYDPAPFPHGRKATLGYIAQARAAILKLQEVGSDQRQILATYVLLKSRS